MYADVFNWLNGEDLKLPTTVKGALGAHLGAGTYASAAPLLDGSDRAIPFSDDADVWNEEPTSPEKLQLLDEQLKNGQLSAFMQVKLL